MMKARRRASGGAAHGDAAPVEALRNIGATIARRLNEIGIRTKGDLREVSSVVAYRRIAAQNPGKTIPVCYYLYSLEGALRNRHWDALDESLKQRLLKQLAPERRSRRTRARTG